MLTDDLSLWVTHYIQRFGIREMFLFDLMQNTVKLFPISIYLQLWFISVIKAEFSASLLQSSVSHDPSEIILICQFAAQEKKMYCCVAIHF